jgi:hypothetical protein
MDLESTNAETVEQAELEAEQTEGQAPDETESHEREESTDNAGKFDEGYVKKLRRESAKLRTELRTTQEELSAFRDRDKTEQEKLTERASDLERRASDAERRALRFEVAASRGLDLKAAGFLTGDTREEVEACADELQKLLSDRKPAGSFDGGARKTVDKSQRTPEQAHNDLLLDALGRPAH